ncbi:MAG: DUF4331 family protein [Gemmatimonadota bacterium]
MRVSTMKVLACAAAVVLAGCQDNVSPMITGTPEALLERTAARQFRQLERLGNPLVSEVMVVKARHQLYNEGQPVTDVATWTGDLVSFVTGVAGRDQAYANTIAGALLPDMLLTYPKRDGKPVFWLSWVFGGYGGRGLADDAVDIGLGALFGNLLGNNNNVTPGLTTDNVPANDVSFGSAFPWLGTAH